MKPRVWAELDLHPLQLARLRAAARVVTAAACDHRLLPGAEFAVIGSSTVDDAFLDLAGPRLKMVVRHGIGHDRVQVPAATARGVLAANTPEGPTEGTAEHAVALMLALAKGVGRADRILHGTGDWAAARSRGIELRGRTLGLVGYGRIGRRVAEICGCGLGMEVIYLDPFVAPAGTDPARARRVDTLDALLALSDVVSLHLGAGPLTRHLIAERQLRAMKPGAILVNTSRGEILDQTALIRVLDSGHLTGAALDVFDPEPAAADTPLLRRDDVVVTPHMASATVESSLRSSTGVVDQILAVIAGRRPRWLIDPAAWPGRVVPA